MKISALQFLINLGEECINDPFKYLQAGHNGPYHHPETLLRNQGHWIVTLGQLYKWTGEEKYKLQLEKWSPVLVSGKVRPYGYSFHHRDVPGKDRCNGLVGQAWTFEALITAAEILGDDRYTDRAIEVFQQHVFNEQYGLWNIVEIDGAILPIDNAFNHQLWFAASISPLRQKNKAVAKKIDIFLDSLWENLSLLDSGLIYHELERVLEDPYQKEKIESSSFKVKHHFKQVLQQLGLLEKPLTPAQKKVLLWDKMKCKSIGYQAFNVYAFTMLKQAYPEHEIWNHPKTQKIADYLLSSEYKEGVEGNKFSFAYNPPGFEIPYVFSEFLMHTGMEDVIAQSQCWLQRQIDLTYDSEAKLFNKTTEDIYTLTARVYELSRAPKEFLEKISLNIN
uniref:Uncharacterized protein n=1 Tax=Roseihalotalea indica TaxID=2867963 RepID=A0AA49GJX5_9BACT|nr:hypothetical protein K4G66_20120 [Tunicatimonas sp. TK19036]